MTKTRFVGDVHGLKNDLALVLDNLPQDVTSVIQVGDMGVGFGQGDYWHESLDHMLKAVNGRFIRGNHDNPSQCREMSTWIEDGLVENDVMFVGGAWSIDYQWRTKDIDLWDDEELSYEQLHRLIAVYDHARPRVMVTHDCPLSVSNQLFLQTGKSFSKQQFKTRTGSALDEMFSIHKPKLHIFGHWHCNTDATIDGTRFVCLDELSYADVDLNTLEVWFPELHR
jgi:Icc-related predicted phosphoesterase